MHSLPSSISIFLTLCFSVSPCLSLFFNSLPHSFLPSLLPSLPTSLFLSSSLSGQKLTVAPFLDLFTHIRFLIRCQSQATHQKFKSNPFGAEVGERCFRSIYWVAQEMAQGFRANRKDAGAVVLCHGNHLPGTTVRGMMPLASR